MTVRVETDKPKQEAYWVEVMENTLEYLDNILRNPMRLIINEEEVVKIEKIKKVTVEAIKHLSKNVNLVDHIEPDSGDVIPKKILNAYKEETFMTYENRFLFTLIRLIEDFIFIRQKAAESQFKGKNFQKANYQADIKLKKEKPNFWAFFRAN